MVIGCCGAGKSTFAQQLHTILDLPLIHLDQYYWKPNWVESDPAEWHRQVKQLASQTTWIMDGNYSGTMDIRIEAAGMICFLNYGKWRCLYRVIKRMLQHYGETRPDMPAGCKERFDLNFLHYVYNFQKTRVPTILKKLDQVRSTKSIHIFENDQEATNFLKELKNHSQKMVSHT